MNIKYRVELSQSERDQLDAMLSGGRHAARKLKRAQILLAAQDGVCDEVIAATLQVSGSTIYRTKRRLVEANLEGALSEEPRWTLELLADEMVRLTDHDALSCETVRRRLAENHLKPWRKDMWCIPKVDGEYVARMEDVLDLYAQAPDPERPVVCFDESPIQLIGEVRAPIPAKPGQLERYDCEYKRNGTLNLFVFLDAHRPSRRKGYIMTKALDHEHKSGSVQPARKGLAPSTSTPCLAHKKGREDNSSRPVFRLAGTPGRLRSRPCHPCRPCRASTAWQACLPPSRRSPPRW
ncbi:hypothetical protein GCM10011494_29510 [Novosphingobium endophyticum]|uniref:Transposase n=1 Tax=Novosphingobium endophyticum TaxID=1955250 RepID=A0A916X6G9_9SPHN|nr:hypothetical protein GCM10011494_29510 [Novosphingobium endophyticum]